MNLLLPALRADVTAHETYNYSEEDALDCAIRVFGGTSDLTTTEDELRAWQRHTNKSFELTMFQGDHFFIRSNRASVLDAIIKDIPADSLPGDCRPSPQKSVCREKPRISSGRDEEKKPHPGTNAPPGTTWRVDGGNKIDQAHQEKGCESSSGSVQAVTRVNVEQASKRAMRTPSPLILGEGWHPEGKTLVQGKGHHERNKPRGSPPE
jgi:hypothetical protein